MDSPKRITRSGSVGIGCPSTVPETRSQGPNSTPGCRSPSPASSSTSGSTAGSVDVGPGAVELFWSEALPDSEGLHPTTTQAEARATAPRSRTVDQPFARPVTWTCGCPRRVPVESGDRTSRLYATTVQPHHPTPEAVSNAHQRPHPAGRSTARGQSVDRGGHTNQRRVLLRVGYWQDRAMHPRRSRAAALDVTLGPVATLRAPGYVPRLAVSSAPEGASWFCSA